MVFVLVGPEYFLGLLWGAALDIAVVSAVAGIVRLLFRGGGFVLSVVCGASIALAGFLIVLARAISRI